MKKLFSKLNNNQTFKPQKNVQPGTLRFELHKKVQSTLVEGHTSAILFEMVQLPPGEDINEWFAVHTIDFYNKINMIYGAISSVCTEQSCPSMTAGPDYLYLWKDKDKYKKATDVPAPTYIGLALDWCEKTLNDDQIFPTNGIFQKNYRKLITRMFTKIFRIYAHIMYTHFKHLKIIGCDKQLNMAFKHFLCFALEFDLIKNAELDVMRDWILNHIGIDVRKEKVKRKKKIEARKRSDSRASTNLKSIAERASLSIEIIEGKSLAAKDLGGTSDPFVEIELDGQVYETSVIWKTLNPQWNEKFNFIVHDTNSKLVLTVKDKNKMSSSKLIGSTEVDLSTLLDEKPHEMWSPLYIKKTEEKPIEKKRQSWRNLSQHESQGLLHFKVQFTAAESGAIAYLSKLTSLDFYQPLYEFWKNLKPSEVIQLLDIKNVSPEPKVYKSVIFVAIEDEKNGYKNIMDILKHAITLEVASCSRPQTLFRANSIATKLMGAYTNLIGERYLRKTLTKVVTSIINESKDLEVDDSRLEKGANVEENMRNLLKHTQDVVDTIMNSIDDIPVQLRELAKHLKNEVKKQFKSEEAALVSISGMMILRFISPALISPQQHQLVVGNPSPKSCRSLLLISKVLQQLANNVEFQKEKYMLGANQFIQNNMLGMQRWLVEICNVPHVTAPNHRDLCNKDRLLWALYNLHSHFHENGSKIAQSISQGGFNTFPIANMDSFKATISKMAEIIKLLGGPPQLSLKHRQKITSAQHHIKKSQDPDSPLPETTVNTENLLFL